MAAKQEIERLAYTIKEVMQATGIGKTSIYKEISLGRLKRIRVAGRTLILKRDLEQFLEDSRERTQW